MKSFLSNFASAFAALVVMSLIIWIFFIPSPPSSVHGLTKKDSIAVSEKAVESYLESEARKKFVADSIATATEFKALDLSGMASLKNAKYSNSYNTTLTETSELYWSPYWLLGHVEGSSIATEIIKSPESLISTLEKNKVTGKKFLEKNGYTANGKKLYERISAWMEGKYPEKEKMFELFFQRYGSLESFPFRSEIPTDNTAKKFWKEMDKMIANDPEFFKDVYMEVPTAYKDWLFYKRWSGKIGAENLKKISDLVKAILY